MTKGTKTEILWRVKNGAGFLPKSDRDWSKFCTVLAPGWSGVEAEIVARALAKDQDAKPHFDFKLGPAKLLKPAKRKRTKGLE